MCPPRTKRNLLKSTSTARTRSHFVVPTLLMPPLALLPCRPTPRSAGAVTAALRLTLGTRISTADMRGKSFVEGEAADRYGMHVKKEPQRRATKTEQIKEEMLHQGRRKRPACRPLAVMHADTANLLTPPFATYRIAPSPFDAPQEEENLFPSGSKGCLAGAGQPERQGNHPRHTRAAPDGGRDVVDIANGEPYAPE